MLGSVGYRDRMRTLRDMVLATRLKASYTSVNLVEYQRGMGQNSGGARKNWKKQ